MSKFLLAAAIALSVAACATAPAPPDSRRSSASDGVPGSGLVAEAWVSADLPGEELDSIATWVDRDGRTLLIATGKSTHRLALFDGDSGEALRTVGGRGKAPGEFTRPNGLAVSGNLLFVVERDTPRVQLLGLPDLQPQGSFGGDELRAPYGIWLRESAPGELEAFVTDSFMYGERHDVVPPAAELSQRVRRYRLRFDEQGHLDAAYLGSFGEPEGPARLNMVESIAGDPVHGRLLVAEEDRKSPSNLHVYGFDGRWSGRSLPEGTFAGEAEGVVLWACGARAGYWLAVDQQAPLTWFHLFDRETLATVGSFHGQVTANTDGIALHAAPTPRFPGGALYAVHDDRAVSAFDLRQIVGLLGLDPACLG
ncbi:phytase [Luteimonas sp. MC1895]|uniref:phytase n=1 Tax=Luteimonas sp. MC1895 TaxID=2819513 RepID=UPI0018F0CC1C|nr:phytase [Luteimonas sp. MC1895]MBJ6978651.1 phytase [Luteimonas sp. MC1895]